jgi:hypothetical protein
LKVGECDSPGSVEVRLETFDPNSHTILLLHDGETTHLTDALQNRVVKLDDSREGLDGLLDADFASGDLELRDVGGECDRRGGERVDEKQVAADAVRE